MIICMIKYFSLTIHKHNIAYLINIGKKIPRNATKIVKNVLDFLRMSVWLAKIFH